MTQKSGLDQGKSRVLGCLSSLICPRVWTVSVWGAVLALALAGCIHTHEASVGLRVAQADLAYGPAALEHAVAEFLGPSSKPAEGGMRSSGTREGGRKKARADINYQEIVGREVVFVLAAKHPLTQGWRIDGDVRLGQGQVKYVMPAGSLRVPFRQGFLSLANPVTLDARNQFIEAEVLLVRDITQPLPGILTLGAGGGVRGTQSRLKVQVDPIKIDSRYKQTQAFGALQARYTLPTVPVHGFAEARIYGRNTVGMRAGLELLLP
jgi:hypothetical protein